MWIPTNGYRVLDIVFGDAMEAELVTIPFEMKDERAAKSSRATHIWFVLMIRTAPCTNVP